MPYHSDPLYGDIAIDDPLILDLLDTPPLQRLRRINQYGGVNYIYPDRLQTTRYEHSLGVWHVLRTLGADRATQVAGLLHDVGHTAFSHMVDQALESTTEDFHEEYAQHIPGMDQVNDLLNRASITLQPIDRYPALKTPMPAIGADRFDYALRDCIAATGDAVDGTAILRHVTLHDGRMHFTDRAVARTFADAFLRGIWGVIYAPDVAVVYQALTEMLRAGLRTGWLTHDDLWTDDASVMKKLTAHAAEFPKQHRLFTARFRVEPGTPDKHDFCHVKLKIRLIDPPVLQHGTTQPLSHCDPQFAQSLAQAREQFLARTEGAYFLVEFNADA